MAMARAGKTTVIADDDARTLRDLGVAVRRRRRALGMTQARLAAAAGLSVPFVSQIETGFAPPSLSSLFAIARVLDTRPELLLAGPTEDHVTLVRHGEGRIYAVTDAPLAAKRRQLTPLSEPFSGAEYTVERSGDLGGYESSPGREMIHVIDGSLLVDIVDEEGFEQTYELNAGDTLIYSTSSIHRWRHSGRKTSRFLHVASERPGSEGAVTTTSARARRG